MCLYWDADKFINHETNSAIKTMLYAMRRKARIFTTKVSRELSMFNLESSKSRLHHSQFQNSILRRFCGHFHFSSCLSTCHTSQSSSSSFSLLGFRRSHTEEVHERYQR